MNKKIINGLLFVAVVVSANGAANASINTETTIDFNSMGDSAYFGLANTATLGPNGTCLTGTCYNEDGMVVGIVQDTSLIGSTGSHIHRVGNATNARLGYDSDSSGIYMRAQDSSAFSLTTMNFRSLATQSNPNATGSYTYEDGNGDIQSVTSVAGVNDYWEILGYSSATNPGLDTAPNSGSWIARQIVTNGFNGVVTLSSAFSNISAFWIHYHGYTQYPTDGKAFSMTLDNIKVNAPASIPVPAAVWLFGTGLMGLLYSGKRKAGQMAV